MCAVPTMAWAVVSDVTGALAVKTNPLLFLLDAVALKTNLILALFLSVSQIKLITRIVNIH